jgi:2'-5' RNA ligase
VRLVPKNDLHLTLVPPWNESDVATAIERLGIVASGCNCFLLSFEHLGYGPTLRHPRLLWAGCAANSELEKLRIALLAAFGREDARPFQPHVTLVRIRRNGRSIARRFPIDRPLALTQCVRSVELFQSPSKNQSGYQVLSSSPLAERSP